MRNLWWGTSWEGRRPGLKEPGLEPWQEIDELSRVQQNTTVTVGRRKWQKRVHGRGQLKEAHEEKRPATALFPQSWQYSLQAYYGRNTCSRTLFDYGDELWQLQQR